MQLSMIWKYILALITVLNIFFSLSACNQIGSPAKVIESKDGGIIIYLNKTDKKPKKKAVPGMGPSGGTFLYTTLEVDSKKDYVDLNCLDVSVNDNSYYSLGTDSFASLLVGKLAINKTGKTKYRVYWVFDNDFELDKKKNEVRVAIKKDCELFFNEKGVPKELESHTNKEL